MESKKVLILSEKFGSGHEMAAQAISKGIKKIAPKTKVSIINFMQYFQPYFSKVTLKMYLKALDIRPEIWGYFYERERNKKRATLPKKFIQIGASFILRDILAREMPDILVCTHPFPCCVASRLRQKGLEIPVVAVITDFDIHGFWVNEYIDGYIVANELLAKSLMKFGVDPYRIFATGIPIDPGYDLPAEKNSAKRALGFKEDMPLIIAAGGGLGLSGLNDESIKILAKDSVQIAVVCGKNATTRRILEEQVERNRICNVRIYGFIENMWDFMKAADLIITKAGGLTLAEALAQEVPIIIYNPLPGQEERNARFLLRQGAARRARNSEELIKLARGLIMDGEKIDRMKEKASRLKKNHSAENAAGIILNMLVKSGCGNLIKMYRV